MQLWKTAEIALTSTLPLIAPTSVIVTRYEPVLMCWMLFDAWNELPWSNGPTFVTMLWVGWRSTIHAHSGSIVPAIAVPGPFAASADRARTGTRTRRSTRMRMGQMIDAQSM